MFPKKALFIVEPTALIISEPALSNMFSGILVTPSTKSSALSLARSIAFLAAPSNLDFCLFF